MCLYKSAVAEKDIRFALISGRVGDARGRRCA
jgi:hypothetical protein